MQMKKRTTKSKWTDPDDAPRLDRDWFARGEIREGDKLIRRGRPKSETATKEAVSLRLDPEVLQHFRATGPGLAIEDQRGAAQDRELRPITGRT